MLVDGAFVGQYALPLQRNHFCDKGISLIRCNIADYGAFIRINGFDESSACLAVGPFSELRFIKCDSVAGVQAV